MRRMIWKNLLYGKPEGDDEDKDKGSDKDTDKDKDQDKGSDKGSDKDKGSDQGAKKGLIGCQLKLSSDVDLAAIAAKYELTGGFIKNAVLSALLSAISRQKTLKAQGCQKGSGVVNNQGVVNATAAASSSNNSSSSSSSSSGSGNKSSSSSSSGSANGHSNPSPSLFNPTAHAQRNSLHVAFTFGSDEEEPVICQADLIKGCKLQMRGSLSG